MHRVQLHYSQMFHTKLHITRGFFSTTTQEVNYADHARVCTALHKLSAHMFTYMCTCACRCELFQDSKRFIFLLMLFLHMWQFLSVCAHVLHALWPHRKAIVFLRSIQIEQLTVSSRVASWFSSSRRRICSGVSRRFRDSIGLLSASSTTIR